MWSVPYYCRDKWFDQLPSQVSVMWWIKTGEYPTIQQALNKIELINQLGPSPQAFNFKHYFDWNGLSNEN